MSAPLYLKDPAAAKFVAGGLAEAEDLFGSPLPDLPALERDEGPRRLARQRPPAAAPAPAALPRGAARADRRAHEPGRRPRARLHRLRGGAHAVVRPLRQADRRQGLLNLFWLAHSREAAEHLRSLEQRSSSLRRGKQSIFPLLQSFYRRIEQDCRWPREGEPPATGRRQPVARRVDHRRRLRVHRGRRSTTWTSRTSCRRTSATGSRPTPSSRSSRCSCARRRGGCARATAGSSAVPRATCRCCLASTTSSRGACCASS